MPKRRTPPPAALSMSGGHLVLSDRFAAFKRLYRWLNLTLIHQATWPLVVILTAAVAAEPEQTPLPWYLARLAGPTLAALFAVVYLRRELVGPQMASAASTTSGDQLNHPEGRTGTGALRQQARFLLIGLPVMVVAVRFLQDPVEPAVKVMLFGLADVAAYHLIHFGVVARSYPDRSNGLTIATALFVLSWGIHDALLTAIGTTGTSASFAFLGGMAIGLAVAVVVRALQRWPGGWLPAIATHWLLIYLVFGFVG